MTRDELERIAPELIAELIEEGVQTERARCIAWLEAAALYSSESEAARTTVPVGKPFDYTEGHNLLAEVEDTRDALHEAYEHKRPPVVIEAAADRYEAATVRLGE